MKNRNTRTLVALLAFALAMLGVSYAFVPLYRVFCQAFGIPLPSVAVGQRPAAAVTDDGDTRTITIRFTGGSDATMPVTLQPVVHSLKVRVGQPVLTAYTGTNATAKGLHGTAVHMLYAMGGVEGVDAASYVDLQQCFCFEEQFYPAHKTVNLPLSFTVSPKLPADIHTINFNYTLFPDPQEAAAR